MAYPGSMYGTTTTPEISPDVQKWFQAVDRDGSGQISSGELRSALANGQGGYFSDTACKLMIGMFDKEKIGTINFEEFQALFKYVNSWLTVFKQFDHDSSGSIQEHELLAAFTQMGYRFSPDFFKYVIQKSDFNRTGSITVDQFIVLCVQIQKFTEAFRARDTLQSGEITIAFEDFLLVALSCSV
ncbi:peflin isoform X2 [Fopius arisanus]|uniref:Peflin isoform X2 n=1 Tax=Fopius arisanus TaxID=64838 RepID=A0A9R1TMD1_9HYME|nr:PREDICTED: peflin isoform X2 [Fopius arisanus]